MCWTHGSTDRLHFATVHCHCYIVICKLRKWGICSFARQPVSFQYAPVNNVVCCCHLRGLLFKLKYRSVERRIADKEAFCWHVVVCHIAVFFLSLHMGLAFSKDHFNLHVHRYCWLAGHLSKIVGALLEFSHIHHHIGHDCHNWHKCSALWADRSL